MWSPCSSSRESVLRATQNRSSFVRLISWGELTKLPWQANGVFDTGAGSVATGSKEGGHGVWLSAASGQGDFGV